MMFTKTCSVLLVHAAVVFSARIQQHATLETVVGSGLQTGALMLQRYELMSLLTSSDWPTKPFPGFDKISYLGRGAFGETWLAYDRKLKKNVAVKFFYRKQGTKIVLLNRAMANREEQAALADAGKECDAPTSIIKGNTHEAGMTRFAECFENKVNDPTFAHLVMEVAGTQNLEEYLAAHKSGLGSQTILRIAKMMLEGLVQMEGQYVHRDIKPANVMLYKDAEDGELYLKFIDFGLVTKNRATAGVAGTPMFLPPEMWPLVPRSASMTSAFDVYSTGETLYSLICGKTFHEFIFSKYGHRGDREISRALNSVDPGTLCTPRSSLQPLFQLVVSGMMPAVASTRASPTALLKSSLFKGIQTLKVVEKPKPVSKPVIQQPVKPVIEVPVVKKPAEPSFLDKCHANKKFWFQNAPACCLQERYDPLRHAICERPCGPNVAYKNGRCENNCQVTSTGSFKFDDKQQCCVSLAWNPPRCIYRDYLPKGDGWGWMHA